MHIHNSALAGINQGAANGRISAAVADLCKEVAAENVSIQIWDWCLQDMRLMRAGVSFSDS